MKIRLQLILLMLCINFAFLKKTTSKNVTSETKSETETTRDSVVTVSSSQASTESSHGSTTITTNRKAKMKKSGSKATATSGKSTKIQTKTIFDVPYGKYGVQPKYFLGDDEKYEDEKSSQRGKENRWPNNTVPYRLEKGKFNANEIKHIEKAMHNISKVTKVKFVKYTNQKGYINITNKGSGCFSSIGYGTGWREVNLVPNCIPHAIMHELLHTLGIQHEQVRPDRDKYIVINWKNIQKNRIDNMKKTSKEHFDTFGLEYGYDSIMHYYPYEFAIDRKTPTMVPKDNKTKLGGSVLTPYDIKRINLMYP